MITALNRLAGAISSLRLTVICLAAALVLVFAGTLAQVHQGLYFVQEQYFQSWFVWWHPGRYTIPVFPGGHLLGAVLLGNLSAAIIRRFAFTWRKTGIQLIHLGIIIMLAGGLATDLLSVTSNMRIHQGATQNYSEDTNRRELAVIDLSDPHSAQVTAIPGGLLAAGGSLTHPVLPFCIAVRAFYRNSELQMIGESNSTAAPAATNGAGARISVTEKPLATRMEERDVMSAVLEIIPLKGGQSCGTWLVSDIMAEPQEFELDGRPWSLQLRPVRYYQPYSLTLLEFTHEVYPGTQIPKDFSSKIMLNNEDHHEHRQVVIYMNHPLRYLGNTYYQSGFEPDNSGTILQVVRNPGYQAPYIACVIVSLGLIYQFTLHLAGFVRRRLKAATAP